MVEHSVGMGRKAAALHGAPESGTHGGGGKPGALRWRAAAMPALAGAAADVPGSGQALTVTGKSDKSVSSCIASAQASRAMLGTCRGLTYSPRHIVSGLAAPGGGAEEFGSGLAAAGLLAHKRGV